jgi:hypothetical protein
MVLMKNSANAFAPAAVCCMATTGMTGGVSPGRVFGPVRGTSAGTVGAVGWAVGVVLLGAAVGVLTDRAGVAAAVEDGEDGEEGGVCAAVALQAAQHSSATSARRTARRIGT